MNILIIANYMLPYAKSFGASQRMYFLARYLEQKGDDVSVIATNVSGYNTFGKEQLKKVSFMTSPNNANNSNIVSKDIKAGIIKNKKVKTVALSLIRYILSGINKFYFNEVDSLSVISTKSTLKKTKEFILKELLSQHYDAIIVSCPQFFLFSLVPFVKKISPFSKVIMDYRDPWNSWHPGSFVTRWKEKHYQSIADGIICTNQTLCDDMSIKYGIDAGKYYVSANGYASDENQNTENIRLLPEGRLNIVYTGEISITPYVGGFRDTTQLIQAISELIDEGYHDFYFTFVGVSDLDSALVTKLQTMYDDYFNFKGFVSSSLAKQYVDNADACLVLHTIDDDSGKFLISGKVYDYIQKRKYMLSIAREDTQHSKILTQNHIGINAKNQVGDIKKMLVRCVQMWKNGDFNKCYNNLDITQFSRAKQIEKYYSVIEEITGIK